MEMVQFESTVAVVRTENAKTKTTGIRLQTAKEWKEANSAANISRTSNQVKQAYNDYLRTAGAANTAGLAAALTTGKLLVKGVQNTPKGMTVRFLKADAMEAAPVNASALGVKELMDALKAKQVEAAKADTALTAEEKQLLASLK
jgi:hypothetical protein